MDPLTAPIVVPPVPSNGSPVTDGSPPPAPAATVAVPAQTIGSIAGPLPGLAGLSAPATSIVAGVPNGVLALAALGVFLILFGLSNAGGGA